MDILELENLIKNTLVSIDYEIKENFNLNKNDLNLFIEEVQDILEYYKFTIYKNAKKSICSKLNIKTDNSLSEEENQIIESYSFDKFLNKLSNKLTSININDEQILENILLIIIGECISLYKKFQIKNCESLNIKQIKITSDNNNCCELCQLNSKLVFDIDSFNLDNIHPYCKSTIIPISINSEINLSNSICDIIHVPTEFSKIINKTITKMSIHYKQWITKKEFIFIDDGESIQISDDNIKIPKQLLSIVDIENIIVKNLIKDKLLESIKIEEWEPLFKMKKDSKNVGDSCIIYSLPFITTTAQIDCKSYILENAVCYILKPDELKLIDNTAYNKFKIIFSNDSK